MKDPLGQLRLRFAELRLVRDGERAQVYAAKDFSGYDVTVAVLTERAALDQGLRRAFVEAVGLARGEAGPSVQSDVHSARPWLAARHPDGPPLVRRFVADLDRHAGAAPAGSLTLAPLPVDAPPPVRPDPTFAPTPPPIELKPATGPAAPAPTPPTPPAPTHPAAPRPATRPRPTPPPVPAQRAGGAPHHQPRTPARPASTSISPRAIITMVIVGAVVLMMCCGSGLANLL
jgi:hypothetical protein